MKRKLTLAMLVSLSTASPLALALGVGDAEVNSTLNAPLRASIPLTDSSGLQVDLLNVSVADESAFSAAGLPRTPLAASVKAEVSRRQGRLVVDLTTERAIREPWLDLLLRFDWPGGQQLREVTLLLDPPNYDQLPALVAASSTAPRETASSPGASAPAAEQPSSRPVARTSAAGAGDAARVRSGDTLWGVAGRLRPDSGISMNQMMVALVEANPEVFPSGNINAMRAGFTLVVPSREDIAARSSAEAERIVQAMNQAWANRGSGAPARVPLGGTDASSASAVASAPDQQGAPASPADEGPSDTADPGTNDEANGDAAASNEAGPRLTLLSDAEVAAEGGVPRDANADAQDGAPSTREQDEETAAAAPLAMRSGAEGEGAFIDPGVLALIQSGGQLTEDQRLLRLEARWRENRQALEAVRSERDTLQSQLGDLREEMEAMRDQLAVLSAGGQGVDAAGAGGVMAPGSEPDASRQTPWWGTLYQGGTDRPLMLGGAALAALLALWALVRGRRRRENAPAAMFNEAGPVGPTASGMAAAGMASGQAQQVDTRSDESEAPVRASMPEAEAINEADIFIAYGRYDQAREVLESSLAREPGRDDLRLKLLRVHLEQGDHGAASRQAEHLRGSGDPDVHAEVDHLMTRYGAGASSAPAVASVMETPAERAIFPVADELPPRRFDDLEAAEEAAAEEGGASGETGAEGQLARHADADDTTSGESLFREAPEQGVAGQAVPEEASVIDEQEDPLARYRPPELEPDSDRDAAPPSDPPESDLPRPGAPDAVDEPPATPLPTREADDGRDIIDYRPPTLEAPPSPREETPMQPSVEFTPSGDGDATRAMPGNRSDRELPDDWEVEEVAFPPLSRDNAHFSATASSTSTLAEARRLLDAGEAGQAHALLESLIDETHDPDVKEEARKLLDQPRNEAE